jgi:hypothetical protein
MAFDAALHSPTRRVDDVRGGLSYSGRVNQRAWPIAEDVWSTMSRAAHGAAVAHPRKVDAVSNAFAALIGSLVVERPLTTSHLREREVVSHVGRAVGRSLAVHALGRQVERVAHRHVPSFAVYMSADPAEMAAAVHRASLASFGLDPSLGQRCAARCAASYYVFLSWSSMLVYSGVAQTMWDAVALLAPQLHFRWQRAQARKQLASAPAGSPATAPVAAAPVPEGAILPLWDVARELGRLAGECLARNVPVAIGAAVGTLVKPGRGTVAGMLAAQAWVNWQRYGVLWV